MRRAKRQALLLGPVSWFTRQRGLQPCGSATCILNIADLLYLMKFYATISPSAVTQALWYLTSWQEIEFLRTDTAKNLSRNGTYTGCFKTSFTVVF
jgi:hypothetical protein